MTILNPGFFGCGCEGEEGERGERGKRGKRGHRGHRGHQGHDGHDGQDGATGATGPTGPTGPTGFTGATGPGNDQVPLIAAARVNISDGVITFQSMFGFVDPPIRTLPGVYELTLSNPPPAPIQTIPTVTPLGFAQHEVVASVLVNGHIQINMFDAAGVLADDPFFIVVHTAPIFP